MQMPPAASSRATAGAPGGGDTRARILVRGAVQGVGFRPFVFGLAQELRLTGAVSNAADGVHIEVEGAGAAVFQFLQALERTPPPHALVEDIRVAWIPCTGSTAFTIAPSGGQAAVETQVLPDLATCPECLAEMRDSTNRRYRYPFLNCTHCGPRFSIITQVPYDRCHTTMAAFEMCPACRAEYDDPSNRRFHAQPTACAACGPALAWWSARGEALHSGEDALAVAAEALRQGQIVAVKGLGGFQLCCDARSDAAVVALRARKQRPSKPFAVMFPDWDALGTVCVVCPDEEALLCSAQAPIVLLHGREGATGLSEQVAPGSPLVGALLPYTPLHHLLMDSLRFPLVATSGNLSDEPICIDELEAVERLGGIADGFLVHDRPIARPMDDSVVRVVDGGTVVFRSARGYAPMSLKVDTAALPILAVGGHQKNSIALAHKGHIILSQHIGDLETAESVAVFEKSIVDMAALYNSKPDAIVADLHPDYRSTRHAEGAGLPLLRVQHHYAHVLSCMAEHGLTGPVLGIAWDGTGYGDDGTIWGGEFLDATVHGFVRRAHLLPFRLPGGEQAMREPYRSAIGLLHEAFETALKQVKRHNLPREIIGPEHALLWQLLDQGTNAPVTTSAGRLFDGVASLLGLCQRASFEGEAAMAFEAIAEAEASNPYAMPLIERDGVLMLDWRPMIRAIVEELETGGSPGTISGRFHATLAAAATETALSLGLSSVVLTGGCFQNARLLHDTRVALHSAGMTVHTHHRVPPNDGGLAVGQAYYAIHQREAS